MTGRFSAPRIAGHFTGEALRVWDVTWGKARGGSRHRKQLRRDRQQPRDRGPGLDRGRRPLRARVPQRRPRGDPREGAPEELAAGRLAPRLPPRRLADGRHPRHGRSRSDAASTRRCSARARLRIDKGRAWKEAFESATGDLELEGTRPPRQPHRDAQGHRHRARRRAHRLGRHVRVQRRWRGHRGRERSTTSSCRKAPLTGTSEVQGAGAGKFDAPVYSVRADRSMTCSSAMKASVRSQASSPSRTTSCRLSGCWPPRAAVQFLGSGTLAFDENTPPICI